MSTDRFGNAYASGLPYARGQILTSTEDDSRKFQEAWRHIAARVRTGGTWRRLSTMCWATACTRHR